VQSVDETGRVVQSVFEQSSVLSGELVANVGIEQLFLGDDELLELLIVCQEITV
jgi:hypothetical protein